MKTVQIKVNKPIPGHLVGDTLHIAVDTEGTPTDAFWRSRLRDAETDGCVEIMQKKTKPVKTKATEEDS